MIEYHSPQAEQFINPGFQLELWSDDNTFTEGPVWNAAGYYLYSDIPANIVCRIEGPGTRTVFIRDSGCSLQDRSFLSAQTGSNGLAYDGAGRLYLCQHGNGAIGRYTNGVLEMLLQHFEGRPFNSPNDIVVDAKGAVYFSDPPYGLKDQVLRPDLRQGNAAFYAWRGGVVTAFCKEYRFPNGLCLAPGEQTLYVCSSKIFERKLIAYDTSSLQMKELVAEENCDGLKCDPSGNLWLCTREGLLLLSAQGERLAHIRLEKEPANCCWGGANGKDLLVTAREHVYCLRNLLR
ncbi:MAG: SMP-30/gluconolactonase/LRE family protein [Chitinophagaceae bacterium]|nr:MAG: SMP-30/gluconolactonase/LRE family protein [Chitinophagaceae bacterium]